MSRRRRTQLPLLAATSAFMAASRPRFVIEDADAESTAPPPSGAARRHGGRCRRLGCASASKSSPRVTEERPGRCTATMCSIGIQSFVARDAWRCVWLMIQVVWHMIQNDLVHGWGLDFALRKCVENGRNSSSHGFSPPKVVTSIFGFIREELNPKLDGVRTARIFIWQWVG